jgi:hypothetical protein
LIAAGASALTSGNTENESGWTPLHYAARNSHAVCVRSLITANADLNARTRTDGSTPLHLAAAAREGLDCIAALLDAGARADLRDSNFALPSAVACTCRWEDSEEACQLLIAGEKKLYLCDLLGETHRGSALPPEILMTIVGFVLSPKGELGAPDSGPESEEDRESGSGSDDADSDDDDDASGPSFHDDDSSAG